MDTVHSRHCDLLDVFLLYSHVGPFDGHRNSTVERTEARDDLQEKRNKTHVDLNSQCEISLRKSGPVFTHICDLRVGALRWRRQPAELLIHTRVRGCAPHTLVGGVGMTTQAAVFSSH